MSAKQQMTSRLYFVLIFFSILPLAVGGQVVLLYLNEAEELQVRGERQASSTVDLPAMRGGIFDQSGRALAINTAQYDLALDPTMPGFDGAADQFYADLGRLQGRSAQRIRRRVENRSSRQYVQLSRGLTEQERAEIETWDVPGVILSPRFARQYNYGAIGGHLLGYVSSDGRGLEGLERQYNDFMTGAPGSRAVQRDRRGHIRPFAGGEVVKPTHGGNIRLTVDLVRQMILEEELHRGVEETRSRWGAAIALDPRTGAILGMSSVPTYDPNDPAHVSSTERRNRAITDRIEPGSTFKLVTAIAALEEGVVEMSEILDTGVGYARVDGRPIRDTRGHGEISFRDVLAYSSNIGTARVASRLDPSILYRTARDLGFGQNTWLDLPGEVSGRLPRPNRWSGTTRPSFSMGYEVAVTPLQMVTAYAALANGGRLVSPHIVEERRDVFGETIWQASKTDSVRRVFSQATADTLLSAFERVVEEGTAKQAQIEGVRVAGKTGTAIKPVNGSYNSGLYRSSFVGFLPADDPSIAMIVVLDEPKTSAYGGATAAPIFKNIAERWLSTMPREATRLASTIPHMEDVEEASAYIHRASLANESTSAMPDVIGLSTREALYTLSELGVEVHLNGSGTIQAQQPLAGSAIPDRAVLDAQ